MFRPKALVSLGMVALLLLATLGMHVVPSTFAYQTEFNGVSPKWQTGGSIPYAVDPGLSFSLSLHNGGNVPDAGAVIDTAGRAWNSASLLEFFRSNVPYDQQSPRGLTAVDFRDPNVLPARCRLGDNADAVACLEWNGNQITNSKTFFNSSPSIRWNTIGLQNRVPGVRDVDFLTVALHEFGHWQFLGDINGFPNHHPEAVMWYDVNVAKQQLRQDDKHGATMLHGPNTGWEPNESWGFTDLDRDPNGTPRSRENVLAYARGVEGYFNGFNPPPELGRVETDLGISPRPGGGRGQARLAGTAHDPADSHAYFTLFTHEEDISPLPLPRNYVRITQGMLLRWCQYNFQRTTMSIDFETAEGPTLRDSPVTDRGGVRLHPAARFNALGQGAWGCFEAPLDPLAGLHIKRWLIGYDNGHNGETGQFRAYFDDVHLVQFGGGFTPTPTPTPRPPTLTPTPRPPTPTPTPTPAPPPHCIPTTWSCWVSQGGVLTDAPGAAAFAGRLYLLAKGSDSSLYYKSSADGVTYTGWTSLGGPLTSAPAGAAFGGRLYVFAKGSDNAMYYRSSADGGNWTAWASLGGSSDTAPATASVGGKLYVFAKAGDSSIAYRSTTNGTTWTAWTTLGGVLTAAPAAAGFQNRIYVFARGSDNRIFQRSSSDGVNFTPWTVYGDGGFLTSAPAAAAYTPSGGTPTLYNFARASDGSLAARYTTDGANYSAWFLLGGAQTGAPAAAGLGGRMYAFARGAGDAVFEKHTPP